MTRQRKVHVITITVLALALGIALARKQASRSATSSQPATPQDFIAIPTDFAAIPTAFIPSATDRSGRQCAAICPNELLLARDAAVLRVAVALDG